jgi:hypothetical protein
LDRQRCAPDRFVADNFLCSCWSPFRVRLFHFRGNWKPIDKSPLSWLQNCRAEYRPRWTASIYIYIQALMRVQHCIFGQLNSFWSFQRPLHVFLFRTCGLVKASRLANRCPLSMRCRTYRFWVVVSWCLGDAFIGYVAGMTGKTLGQCRHCRQKPDMNDLWNAPFLSSGC